MMVKDTDDRPCVSDKKAGPPKKHGSVPILPAKPDGPMTILEAIEKLAPEDQQAILDHLEKMIGTRT